MPEWPRGMTRDLAAVYVGVSPNKFSDMVREGKLPTPLPYGRWDRKQIDAALDRMTESEARNPFDE